MFIVTTKIEEPILSSNNVRYIQKVLEKSMNSSPPPNYRLNNRTCICKTHHIPKVNYSYNSKYVPTYNKS